MADQMYVRGTPGWRQVSQLWHKVAGSWERVTDGWYKVGGTWEKIHTARFETYTETSNYGTGSQTFTTPTNLVSAQVELWGGGGGSAYFSTQDNQFTTRASGAGGGGYTRRTYTPSQLGGSVSFTVGLGGAPVIITGGDGQDTTFLSMTASGGEGGKVHTALNPFVSRSTGGAASGGQVNEVGGQGAFAETIGESYDDGGDTDYAGPGGGVRVSSVSAGTSSAVSPPRGRGGETSLGLLFGLTAPGPGSARITTTRWRYST